MKRRHPSEESKDESSRDDEDMSCDEEEEEKERKKPNEDTVDLAAVAPNIVELGQRFCKMRNVRQEIAAIDELTPAEMQTFKLVMERIYKKEIPLYDKEKRVINLKSKAFKEFICNHTSHTHRKAILQKGRFFKALVKLMTDVEAV